MPVNRVPPKPQTAAQLGATVRPFESAVLRRVSVCHADMPPGVYKVAVFCWAAFMAVFWITFFFSTSALFMVIVGTVYAVMFFGVPYVMSRMAPKSSFPSMREFIHGRLDTFCGPIEAGEALLQVLLVPLALTVGGIAIGIAIHLARTGG